MRRRRTMREEERELWAHFVRGIKPLGRPGDVPLVPPTASTPRPDDTVRRNAEGPVNGPVVPEPSRAPPRERVVIPRSGVFTFLTQGEMAVAAHLRGRALKKTKHADTFIGTPQAGLDSGSWKRLHKGHTPVEGRLDLHGMTAQAAFLRLHEFLIGAHRNGLRCVEIVTGLGSGPEGGVLRRELPFWLGRDDLRRLILAATHSHENNRGAVRVLLRRRNASRR